MRAALGTAMDERIRAVCDAACGQKCAAPCPTACLTACDTPCAQGVADDDDCPPLVEDTVPDEAEPLEHGIEEMDEDEPEAAAEVEMAPIAEPEPEPAPAPVHAPVHAPVTEPEPAADEASDDGYVPLSRDTPAGVDGTWTREKFERYTVKALKNYCAEVGLDAKRKKRAELLDMLEDHVQAM